MLAADGATAAFEAERTRLVRLAYRMLGSIGEAEDVVQDAWMRWRQVDHVGVASRRRSCRELSRGSASTS